MPANDRGTFTINRPDAAHYPGIPATVTNESAVAFATDFERVVVWRTAGRNTTQMNVDVEYVDSWRTNEGWVVRLEVGVSRTVLLDGAEAVVDSFPYYVEYYVTPAVAKRDEANRRENEEANPVADGAVVAVNRSA